MNFVKVLKYQLYLLQLENYELGRFWKLLVKRGWFPSRQPLRKNLVWTAKALLILILSQTLIFISAALVCWWLYVSALENRAAVVAVFIGAAVIFQFLVPIFLSLAVVLLWPVDWAVKKVLVMRAKRKIQELNGIKGNNGENGGLTVIGIAGSYGKTTMKEVLHAVLSGKFKVESTPESVNTPVGIARWILKNSKFPFDRLKVRQAPSEVEGQISNFKSTAAPSSEGKKGVVAIIEMGEHYRGDVEDICEIARPDIAVVTGINEAHLERMKKMDVIVTTIFEIVSKAKAGALVVLNGDDKHVMGHYKEFVWPDHRVEKFSIFNFQFSSFNAERLGWEAQIDGVGNVFINLLGEYALAYVDAAVKIGKNLGMTNEEIIAGIKNIKPVEHRLQGLRSAGDIIVIDDAYNGNPDGVAEAIKVLSRFQNRRKVFITPGLVEMGKSAPEIHRNIGKQLAGVADVVVLIRNSVTGYIEEGVNRYHLPPLSRSTPPIKEESGPSSPPNLGGVSTEGGRGGIKPQIIWFNTAPEAHQKLSTILKPGDVVLFQNDWGDQYI